MDIEEGLIAVKDTLTSRSDRVVINDACAEINRLREALERLSILPTLDDDDFEFIEGCSDIEENDAAARSKHLRRAHAVLAVMMMSLLREFHRDGDGENTLEDIFNVAQGAGMAISMPVQNYMNMLPAEKRDGFEDLLFAEIRRAFDHFLRRPKQPND